MTRSRQDQPSSTASPRIIDNNDGGGLMVNAPTFGQLVQTDNRYNGDDYAGAARPVAAIAAGPWVDAASRLTLAVSSAVRRILSLPGRGL